MSLEKSTPLLGVSGRFTERTTKPGQAPGLWCRQRWISAPRNVPGWGAGAYMVVEIRFDDECNNGHNSFAITATIQRPRARDIEAGGCLHDEIAEFFPELAPLIKWHLCGSDAPMHYLANTVYLAGDRDYNGRKKGERYHVKGHEEKRILFGEFPISFKIERKAFGAYLETVKDWQAVEPVAVEHENKPGETYKFSPKYTLAGHPCAWWECPFDRIDEAREFLEAARRYPLKVVVFAEKFTRIGEGKERELDAARRAAIWPEATDAELSVKPAELRDKLAERLPALLADFRRDLETAGFIWAPDNVAKLPTLEGV